MHILMGGASGLIGSRLVAELAQAGHRLTRLVRRTPASPDERIWDPATGLLDPDVLTGVDAVVHLGGASVGEGRWSADRKQVLRDSRLHSTALLAHAMAAASNPPATFLCASATGYYGHRGDEVLTEASGPGTGFLADLCVEWEAACGPAAAAGVRVVHARLGVVLDPAGGALERMLGPFRMGVGGRLGNGRQWMSWIAGADATSALRLCLSTPSLRGPVNVVAPEPVTNADFTRALGRALHRPTVLAVPAFALRLGLGEMANEALLSSTRAVPRALQAAGFHFDFKTIDEALAPLGG